MPDDRPVRVFGRLLSYLHSSWGRLALVFLGLGLSSAALLLTPWLAKDLFRDAVLNNQAEGVYGALLLILVVLLGRGLGRFLSDDQLEIASLQMTERARRDLVQKLLRLPPSYFVQNRTGDVMSRVFNDVRALKEFTQHACVALGGDLLSTVGAVAMLFLLNWRLAFLLGIMVPVAAWLIIHTSRWIRARFHRAQAALGDMTGLLSEQVRHLAAVQAYGGIDFEERRFEASAQVHFREGTTAHRIHAATRAGINFLGAFALVGILALGASQLEALRAANTEAPLPIEQLVGFALYAAIMVEPLTRFSRINYELQRCLAAGRRILEFLDLPEQLDEGRRPVVQQFPEVLRFERVRFHYRPEEPVLTEIDFTVRRGEPVAVVGPSGAGKSSLAALVMRFYDPVAGRVHLDGCDLRELRRDDLLRHVGWVGQEPFLLSGTVLDNIRYGAWEASRAEVEAAARLACADSFIQALPQGYESRIGERGIDLSGGQRARLALARVIVRNPALVILDEVTAALDTETEAQLWDGLQEWLASRTTLIIAHRLRTVLTCPRIVVLEEGRKVGEGSAGQLQRTCPTFQRLFLEQMNLVPRAA